MNHLLKLRCLSFIEDFDNRLVSPAADSLFHPEFVHIYIAQDDLI